MSIGPLFNRLESLSEASSTSSRAALKRLATLVSELADAENAYVKTANKALKQFSSHKFTDSPTDSAIVSLKTQIEQVVRARSDLASDLERFVKTVTDGPSQKQESQGAFVEFHRLREDIDRVTNEIPRAHQRYHKLARDAEEALLELEKARWKFAPREGVLNKLEANYEAKKRNAEAAEAAYSNLVNEANTLRECGTDRLRGVVDTCYRVESDRIQSMQASLSAVHRIFSQAASFMAYTFNEAQSIDSVLDGSLATFKQELDSFAVTDLSSFIPEHRFIAYTFQLDHSEPAPEPDKFVPLELQVTKVTGPIVTHESDLANVSHQARSAKALYDYDPPREVSNGLRFVREEIITITADHGEWLEGEILRRIPPKKKKDPPTWETFRGAFPREFVELVSDAPQLSTTTDDALLAFVQKRDSNLNNQSRLSQLRPLTPSSPRPISTTSSFSVNPPQSSNMSRQNSLGNPPLSRQNSAGGNPTLSRQNSMSGSQWSPRQSNLPGGAPPPPIAPRPPISPMSPLPPPPPGAHGVPPPLMSRPPMAQVYEHNQEGEW